MNIMIKKKYVAPIISVIITEGLCSSPNTASVVSGPNNDHVDKFEVNENIHDEWLDNTDNWGGN